MTTTEKATLNLRANKMDEKALSSSKSLKNPSAVFINVGGGSNQQQKDEEDVNPVNVFSISGLGVDEEKMGSAITTMVKWNDEEKKYFRERTPFSHRRHLKQLKHEFLRFMRLVEIWTMDPRERDARLIKDALSHKHQKYNVVIEIACTRTSKKFLDVRTAYHSLFDCSIEEDIYPEPEAPLKQKEADRDYQAKSFDRKLLVALVSTYRYEGPVVHEDTAELEAETLRAAIKNLPMVHDGTLKSEAKTHNAIEIRNLVDEEEVVRILSTRSKDHLKSLFKHYKDNPRFGKTIDEDVVDPASLKQTVQCLSDPYNYFKKVLDAAMDPSANDDEKEGLIRMITTRADVDIIGKIFNEYRNEYGESLAQRIGKIAKGNFKDFLVSLLEGPMQLKK